MREHREKVAEEARDEVRGQKPEQTDSAASGPRADGADLPTGEKRAATNRDEDPPA